jgi:predicted ArsR family transcriptional regulator
MQLTRQQILDYLQTNRVATPVEMSRALQVTAANIRHHLRILREAGLVDVVGTRKTRGRGHPMKLYSLTERALQDSLEVLSAALLTVVLADTPDVDAALERIAAAILGLLPSGERTRPSEPGGGASQQTALSCRLGGFSRWPAGDFAKLPVCPDFGIAS